MARPAFFALNDPALEGIPFINADRAAERRSPGRQKLPVALAHSERAPVFDNTEGCNARPVFGIRDQRILLLRHELPNWNKTAFQMDNAIVDASSTIERCLQDLRQNSR